MGKHQGKPAEERRSMTDIGIPFSGLTPEQKAAEMAASHRDPVGYATRNFGASTDPEAIDDARRSFGFDTKNKPRG